MISERVRTVHGETVWMKDGRIHRDDGPALIDANNNESWYQKGKLHRIGGPALITHTGRKVWCVRGAIHRTDGPAVMDLDGRQEWYVRSTKITCPVKYQAAANLSDEQLAAIIAKYGDIC